MVSMVCDDEDDGGTRSAFARARYQVRSVSFTRDAAVGRKAAAGSGMRARRKDKATRG
jgi:hypothetical protein